MRSKSQSTPASRDPSLVHLGITLHIDEGIDDDRLNSQAGTQHRSVHVCQLVQGR